MHTKYYKDNHIFFLIGNCIVVKQPETRNEDAHDKTKSQLKTTIEHKMVYIFPLLNKWGSENIEAYNIVSTVNFEPSFEVEPKSRTKIPYFKVPSC